MIEQLRVICLKHLCFTENAGSKFIPEIEIPIICSVVFQVTVTKSNSLLLSSYRREALCVGWGKKMWDKTHALWVLRELSVYGGSQFVQFCGLSCDVCVKGKDGTLLEEISEKLWLTSAIHVFVCLCMHKEGSAQEVVFCPKLKLGLYLQSLITRVAGNLEEERKP